MILVTGGAGYIGSHYVKFALNEGHDVVVLDNLSEGHTQAILTDKFEQVDLLNKEQIDVVFKKYPIDCVIHFAASCYVGESSTNPRKYYTNNFIAGLNLLNAMIDHHVKKIIFSSSCATYGNPLYTPIDEAHPQNPINVYGENKLFLEKALNAYEKAYGLQSISLRYFNAAGADPEGILGESHKIETHLIPLVLQAAMDSSKSITVFGNDYDTPDGTCMRDYIHTNDLALAHSLAYQRLNETDQSDVFNLGIGKGFSVKEVIEKCQKITGKKIHIIQGERRPGDPPVLVAKSDKAQQILNWQPYYRNIDDIIETAWQWELHKKY